MDLLSWLPMVRRTRHGHNRPLRRLARFEQLERRDLLTTGTLTRVEIQYDESTGVATIEGNRYDDEVYVSEIAGTGQIEVLWRRRTPEGLGLRANQFNVHEMRRVFQRSELSQVVFRGGDGYGHDRFVNSTSVASVVDGGDGADYLVGGFGNDIIRGGGSGDHIEGGGGFDELWGGAGNDRIWGGDGENHIWGGDGDDYLDGGPLFGVVYGERGNDRLIGGVGHDRLYGGDGDDRLEGGYGDDFLSGGNGNDFLQSGEGTNILIGGAGDDTLHGGNGVDILAGDFYNVLSHVFFGFGNDTLIGNGGDDLLIGGLGHDTLLGDSIFGGFGNDWMIGDYLDPLSSGDDRMFGAGGADHMFAGGGSDAAWGDQGDDWIVGWYGQDELHGGAGDDILLGGAQSWAMWPFMAAFGFSLETGSLIPSRFDWPIQSAERNAREVELIDAAFERWGDLGLADERVWERHAEVDDVAVNSIFGDDGDDWLTGGDNYDELHGGRGADVLVARGRVGDLLNPGDDEDADLLVVRRRRFDYAPDRDSFTMLSEDEVVFVDDIPSER